MITKIISLIFLLFICYLFPLQFESDAVFHFKIITLVGFTSLIWLTQPAINHSAHREATDRNTMLLILCLTVPTVVIPVICWSLFKEQSEKDALDWIHITGLILLVGGLTLRVYAIRVLDHFFSARVLIRDDHQLITSGPYRWLRHPSYTGAFLCYLGSCLWLGVWGGAAIAALLMGYAYYRRVTVEEEALQNRFGEVYDIYSRQTWRMIPWIW